MAKLTINNFNGGEVSPYLYAREDVDGIYNKSCLKMENFIPLPYGGASKRPATKYLGNSHSGKVRLIPFTFSVSENYLLEFGNLYVRVWKNDSPHVTAQQSQIILDTPYTINDLNDLKFAQSADILFITDQSHPPQQIKRLSDTNWSVSELEWTFPPMMEENADVTHFITTTASTGETILTSNINLFQPEHVGGYFQFRVARTNSNLNLEKKVTTSHVSDSINVSNSNWDFETGSTWSGRVTIDRSLDGGVSFQEYITVADTSSITTATELKNFSVSSPSKEGSNTFLRVQYEKGSASSNSFQYYLTPTDPYITSLVKITAYTSATQVTANIISNFQHSIGDFSSNWTFNQEYTPGNKVKSSSGLEYGSISRDLSGIIGVLATVDQSSGNDSSRTAGTYDFVDGTTNGISNAGSGSGARIRVVVASGGGTTISVIAPSGKSYAVNDTFTITDAALGGGGAANLTFDVASVTDCSGLDNTRGGTWGDGKYFAIDNALKVHVFTKDGSDNFTPYDQWTASGFATYTSVKDGIDIGYYSNHLYVFGGYGSERTISGAGGLSAAPELRIYKYNLDGSNASLFKTIQESGISFSPMASATMNTLTHVPQSIGIKDGKFYCSYKIYGRFGTTPHGPDPSYHLKQIKTVRLSSAGSLEETNYAYDYKTVLSRESKANNVSVGTKDIVFYVDSASLYDGEITLDLGSGLYWNSDTNYRNTARFFNVGDSITVSLGDGSTTTNPDGTYTVTEVTGTTIKYAKTGGDETYSPNTDTAKVTLNNIDNFTDAVGIDDPSVNRVYFVNEYTKAIDFKTDDFVGAGTFSLTTEFPSTTPTASFYDDSINDGDLYWVADTAGNIKKYNFSTKATYYENILTTGNNPGTTLAQQVALGMWYEVNPEMEHWAEGAFSDYRGYPNSLAFFEGRLVFAGTTNQPNTVWLSEIDNFFAFDPGSLDTDPIRFTINSGTIDGIQWLVPHRQLIIGTSGSEWSLGSESDNKPVTPTSFDLKRRTTYGSSSIAGLLVNSAVLFFMRQGKKLREWIFNDNSQDYVAPDLTLVAEHISGTGFKTIALQQQPDNIVWTINSNDELVGMTYERDQKVIGWHRHKCTGAFESVMVLPNASSADSVYVSIKVTVSRIRNDLVINEDTEVNNDRVEVRYICKLDDREWGTNYTTQYNGLDYYKVATNVSTGTISGYNYGIGETYTIVANGNTTLSGVVDSDGDLNIGTATELVISSASLEASHLVLNFSEPHGLAVGDTINVSGLSTGSTDPNGKYLLEDGSITDADTITTDLTGSNQSYTTSGSSKVTAYILSAIRNDSVINEDTEVNNDRLGPFARLVIGKLYTGTLAPLYLNYQSRNGSTGGSKLNASKATLRFKDTVTAKVGQTELSSDLQIVKFKKPENEEMVSETAEAYMSNAPEYLQTVYVVSDEPQPCTVLSMTPHVDTGSIR
mgnify:FL=1|tara:strand:+ start:7705 stop:12024 length:4320 start_codon:yes stop_codon:yes gene_type:complete